MITDCAIWLQLMCEYLLSRRWIICWDVCSLHDMRLFFRLFLLSSDPTFRAIRREKTLILNVFTFWDTKVELLLRRGLCWRNVRRRSLIIFSILPCLSLCSGSVQCECRDLCIWSIRKLPFNVFDSLSCLLASLLEVAAIDLDLLIVCSLTLESLLRFCIGHESIFKFFAYVILKLRYGLLLELSY